MHECPYCGMACDCDGDDTWITILDPADCSCECEVLEEMEIEEDQD